MRLEITTTREPDRCALCHSPLERPLAVCSACGTALHEDCRASLASCPTLGCALPGSGTRVAATPFRTTVKLVSEPRSFSARFVSRAVVLGALAIPAFVAVYGYTFGYAGMASWIEPGDVAFGWLLSWLIGGGAYFAAICWPVVFSATLGKVRATLLGVVLLALVALAQQHAHDAGVWTWERRVLAPRAEPLRRALAAGTERGLLDELGIAFTKNSQHGLLLYRWDANPIQSGFGLCLAKARPRDGYGFAFSESSVPGIYYFHEFP